MLAKTKFFLIYYLLMYSESLPRSDPMLWRTSEHRVSLGTRRTILSLKISNICDDLRSYDKVNSLFNWTSQQHVKDYWTFTEYCKNIFFQDIRTLYSTNEGTKCLNTAEQLKLGKTNQGKVCIETNNF